MACQGVLTYYLWKEVGEKRVLQCMACTIIFGTCWLCQRWWGRRYNEKDGRGRGVPSLLGCWYCSMARVGWLVIKCLRWHLWMDNLWWLWCIGDWQQRKILVKIIKLGQIVVTLSRQGKRNIGVLWIWKINFCEGVVITSLSWKSGCWGIWWNVGWIDRWEGGCIWLVWNRVLEKRHW